VVRSIAPCLSGSLGMMDGGAVVALDWSSGGYPGAHASGWLLAGAGWRVGAMEGKNLFDRRRAAG